MSALGCPVLQPNTRRITTSEPLRFFSVHARENTLLRQTPTMRQLHRMLTDHGVQVSLRPRPTCPSNLPLMLVAYFRSLGDKAPQRLRNVAKVLRTDDGGEQRIWTVLF